MSCVEGKHKKLCKTCIVCYCKLIAVYACSCSLSDIVCYAVLLLPVVSTVRLSPIEYKSVDNAAVSTMRSIAGQFITLNSMSGYANVFQV